MSSVSIYGTESTRTEKTPDVKSKMWLIRLAYKWPRNTKTVKKVAMSISYNTENILNTLLRSPVSAQFHAIQPSYIIVELRG